MYSEENDILGAGAYGRVFKGVLTSLPAKESLDVAIKTIRPGVDVIYFKALLSELKVMAFLGNGHENLVHLKAACTEGIKNGEIMEHLLTSKIHADTLKYLVHIKLFNI